MRYPILSVLAAVLLLGSASGTMAAAPPENDCRKAAIDALKPYWVLALTWHPGFCQIRRKKECAEASLITHLTLHGLWPQGEEYCRRGMPDSTEARQNAWINADCSGRWRRLPDLVLGPELGQDLQRLMPGVAAHLDRHEYFKHGTCSGLTPQAYIETALHLTETVNATALDEFFTAHAGKADVTIGAVCQAVREALGEAAAMAVEADVIETTFQGQPRHFLTELRLWLQADDSGTLGLTAGHVVPVPAGQRTLGPHPADPLCDDDPATPVYIDLPGMDR